MVHGERDLLVPIAWLWISRTRPGLQELRSILKQTRPSTVFHLAAETRLDATSPSFYEANVSGVANVSGNVYRNELLFRHGIDSFGETATPLDSSCGIAFRMRLTRSTQDAVEPLGAGVDGVDAIGCLHAARSIGATGRHMFP